MAINIGAPQVAYRETIGSHANVEYSYKKQFPGGGEFARVILHLEPLPSGAGRQFENGIRDGSVLAEYVPGVEKGVLASLDRGVVAGFPVIDIRVTLTDGNYHDIDSSVIAFEIAARSAMKEGLPKAEPILLEPVMRVEVVTPDICKDDVCGDLRSRRGHVTGQDPRGGNHVIEALVPLANLFGYAKTLASMSQGQATHEMAFSHYDRVPPPVPDDPTFRPAIGMRA